MKAAMLCVLILLSTTASQAQPQWQIPADVQGQVNALKNAPPEQWLELTAKIMGSWINAELWPEAQRLDSRLSIRPEIEIRMQVADDFPYVERGTIIFPGVFMVRAQLSSYLVVHDIYVDSGHRFIVPDPVLQRPYAVSAILKWLRTASLDPRTPIYRGLLNSLACYNLDQQCADLQMAAWTSALIFSIAHEYGHLTDSASVHEYQYSLVKEQAADAFALRLLSAVGFDDTSNPTLHDVYGLAPAALFTLKTATLPRGPLRTDVDMRIAAYLKGLPQATQDRFQGLLGDAKETQGMQAVTLSWEGNPGWIAIDGIRYSPTDLESKTLHLTADSHEVFAWGPEGLAYEEVVLDSGPRQVRLGFLPFRSARPDPRELVTLKRRYDYAEIIRRTATPQLTPRNPEVAFDLFEALEWCRMQDFIDPTLLPADASEDQRRTVDRWSREGKPFAAWLP